MKKTVALLALAMMTVLTPPASAREDKPTIVLVHGAFAEASSWNGVTTILQEQGYPVVAVANPLRGVKDDAAYLGDIVASIKAPVVLVGHSYGGLVIGETPTAGGNVKALVFVAAFAADAGETAAGLSALYPGSTLGPALAAPVRLSGGGADLYIRRERFHDQFAADVSADAASLMAATQRPVTEAALNEPASRASWKQLPSWFIHGDQDRNIPPAALAFMADRAGPRKSVVIAGASHVVMVSHPRAVADLVMEAAASR